MCEFEVTTFKAWFDSGLTTRHITKYPSPYILQIKLPAVIGVKGQGGLGLRGLGAMGLALILFKHVCKIVAVHFVIKSNSNINEFEHF